jgi:glutaminyl-peptide cyclotransferase
MASTITQRRRLLIPTVVLGLGVVITTATHRNQPAGAQTTVAPSVEAKSVTATKLATVRVHRTIPKEPGGFTEGLEVRNGMLYESVGLRGQSEMRIVDLATGVVKRRSALDKKYFAEGASFLANGEIVQLTWQEGIALRRDPKTLAEKGTYTYQGEGWGLCNSSARKALVHSDGSTVLRLRDPKTFRETGSIKVHRIDGSPVIGINELECDGASVFANIWTTTEIIEIDARTGLVKRSIDAASLVPPQVSSPEDVLNGIAALGKGRYLITGKRWPSYFEVSFVDQPNT